jgi:hypothetical protein
MLLAKLERTCTCSLKAYIPVLYIVHLTNKVIGLLNACLVIGQPSSTDRGKRGTKRHVLTDQKGIPLFVSITGANTHDMKAAIDTLDTMIVQRPSYKQNLCLDKGYDFPEIEKEGTKRRYIPHIRHRGEERFRAKIFCKEMGCRKNKFLA